MPAAAGASAVGPSSHVRFVIPVSCAQPSSRDIPPDDDWVSSVPQDDNSSSSSTTTFPTEARSRLLLSDGDGPALAAPGRASHLSCEPISTSLYVTNQLSPRPLLTKPLCSARPRLQVLEAVCSIRSLGTQDGRPPFPLPFPRLLPCLPSSIEAVGPVSQRNRRADLTSTGGKTGWQRRDGSCCDLMLRGSDGKQTVSLCWLAAVGTI